MDTNDDQPLILTLRMDPNSQSFFENLRQNHFPPKRNFIPAHLTLFHKLPGKQSDSIQKKLLVQCSHLTEFPISFPGVWFLGAGVAVEVRSQQLIALRENLKSSWAPWLSAQDNQPFKPHITIQNKVDPQKARQLFQDLKLSWQVFQGRAEGLLLWEYLGGPWDLLQEYQFML